MGPDRTVSASWHVLPEKEVAALFSANFSGHTAWTGLAFSGGGMSIPAIPGVAAACTQKEKHSPLPLPISFLPWHVHYSSFLNSLPMAAGGVAFLFPKKKISGPLLSAGPSSALLQPGRKEENIAALLFFYFLAAS